MFRVPGKIGISTPPLENRFTYVSLNVYVYTHVDSNILEIFFFGSLLKQIGSKQKKVCTFTFLSSRKSRPKEGARCERKEGKAGAGVPICMYARSTNETDDFIEPGNRHVRDVIRTCNTYIFYGMTKNLSGCNRVFLL